MRRVDKRWKEAKRERELRWGIEQVREMGGTEVETKRGGERKQERGDGERQERGGRAGGGDRGESVRVKEEEGG